MLRKSSTYIYENGTKRVLNNFSFNMSKRFDRICPDRSTTTTESIANGKTIKIHLYVFLRPTLTDLNYKLPKKEIAAVKQVM